MRHIAHFSSVAALLMIVPSATLTTHYSVDQTNQKAMQSEKATLWHTHSNGCAPGNNPPPGTNC